LVSISTPPPEDNPLTTVKVALGRRLFFDKKLSRVGTLACAEGPRNSPAIVDRGWRVRDD